MVSYRSPSSPPVQLLGSSIHLSPGYYIERIFRGKVYEMHRTANCDPYLKIVYDYLALKKGGNPQMYRHFREETEHKLEKLYLDSEHSRRFWSDCETSWLPKHLQQIKERPPRNRLQIALNLPLADNSSSGSITWGGLIDYSVMILNVKQ